MSWRTIIISSEAKLSVTNNYLVVKAEQLKRVHLSEIDVVIVENNRCLLTAPLLIELASANIGLIICDSKHNPFVQSLPIYGHFRQSGNIKEQLQWSVECKASLWKLIVEQKIYNQLLNIKEFYPFEENSTKLLTNYYNSVKLNDKSNREGAAAKVYFKQLFGDKFVRHNEDHINWSLNYAYAILTAYFNRSLISKGLILELGIYHRNEYNNFNLSCDFMEVFRPIIDQLIIAYASIEYFDHNTRREIVQVFNKKVYINKKQEYISNAINIYLKSVIEYLNGVKTEVLFPSLEHEL